MQQDFAKGITRIDNGRAASFTAAPAAGAGIAVTPGHDIDSMIVGIIHRF
jgi:hypothetical protein